MTKQGDRNSLNTTFSKKVITEHKWLRSRNFTWNNGKFHKIVKKMPCLMLTKKTTKQVLDVHP